MCWRPKQVLYWATSPACIFYFQGRSLPKCSVWPWTQSVVQKTLKCMILLPLPRPPEMGGQVCLEKMSPFNSYVQKHYTLYHYILSGVVGKTDSWFIAGVATESTDETQFGVDVSWGRSMKVHLVVDKTNHANRTHGKALDGKMVECIRGKLRNWMSAIFIFFLKHHYSRWHGSSNNYPVSSLFP